MAVHEIDRLAMRARPAGSAVMRQQWDNLLFLHWPLDPNILRPLIPSALDIDTFEGQAWIGITPFRLNDLRVLSLPAIPGLSAFDELNVRTYVVFNGIPGVWFFSLDASLLIATVAARLFFMLPYHKAQTSFTSAGDRFSFDLRRTANPAARFRASWRVGNRLRDPAAESLAFFLVERYCYFAVEADKVFQTRIYHHPWILEEAQVEELASTMCQALGIPEPANAPLVHFSRSLPVDIWAPQALLA